MASNDWPQIKIDEMIRRGVLAMNDGYRVRNVELGPIGIPFVRGGDIGYGEINTTVADHIRPEFIDRVRSKLTRPYDVAFITKGTVGRVGMIRLGQPPSVFAPQVCYWRSLDLEQLEPRFLFYLLTSAEFQANLDAVKTHGSMVADYVSMTDQRDFRLTFPPIREQRAIAAVLGALDDKIELNRRMNATLESMARALFQSWFVDFDPVRTKLDGHKPTGMDAATASMFPDSFDDSTVGQIPHGWRAAHLEEIASVGSGKRPEGRSDVLSPECSIPLYGGGGRMGYVPSALYDKPILFTGRVGTLGFIFRTAESSWPSDNTLVVEPQNEFFDFTYFTLKRFALIALNRGSTQPLLTQSDLRRQTFVLPPKSIVETFADVSEPIFRQIASNDRESRTLATLRDTLLPKLLSGELSVAEAMTFNSDTGR